MKYQRQSNHMSHSTEKQKVSTLDSKLLTMIVDVVSSQSRNFRQSSRYHRKVNSTHIYVPTIYSFST